MADLSDVETVLLGIINGAVYPNGTSQPSIAAVDIHIYRGWPVAAQLDADLAAGKINISVFSPPGMERNTTRYHRDEIETTRVPHTLTTVVNGNQITIGGTISSPQNVIAVCGTKFAFAYAVQPGDTLNSVASGLAALIAASFPGTASSGPVITIAGSPGTVQARVATSGSTWTEQKRQERRIQITCWCPTPAQRDLVAPAVDVALASIDFLALPDGSGGRIRYENTSVLDSAEKVQSYRRDLFYCVEYPTSTIKTAYEIGTLETTVTGGQSSDGTPGNAAGGAVSTYI